MVWPLFSPLSALIDEGTNGAAVKPEEGKKEANAPLLGHCDEMRRAGEMPLRCIFHRSIQP